MPEKLEEAGWTGGEAISNCRLMVHYYRTTKDGRIAFGQGGRRHAFGGRVQRLLRPQRRQPSGAAEGSRPPRALRGRRDVTHGWGGPIDRTSDGAADLRPARRDACPIVYGVGYSGNGVAPSPHLRQDPRVERARPRRRVVGAAAQQRRRRALPTRADPLPRRFRRSWRRASARRAGRTWAARSTRSPAALPASRRRASSASQVREQRLSRPRGRRRGRRMRTRRLKTSSYSSAASGSSDKA